VAICAGLENRPEKAAGWKMTKLSSVIHGSFIRVLFDFVVAMR
jgi:hypothetical protein